MDMARVWPIVCQFGVGAILCWIGTWAGIRSGFVDFKLPEGRRVVAMVILGYLGLLLLSCAFTFWLPYAVGEGTP